MAQPPNILIVVVDDMGIHQLGCYGSRFYETPAIDRLASQGARFDCAYGASPVCSPSRAALYTGLHPARLHLTNFIPGTEPINPRLLTPPWRAHLPVDVNTLGDVFKANGYATGHFGKWHLAPDYHYVPGRAMDPESQGFDSVLVTRKPLPGADPEGDSHHVDEITERAITFMSEPTGRPFVCVVAHNALHRPEIAPRALQEHFAAKPGAHLDHNRPVLAAMMARVDQSIQRMIEFLDTTGRGDNTIVVFTADHGAFGRSEDRKPLRGGKADLYEGGIRVPMLMRWTGVIPSGTPTRPVFGTDLLPTLLELTGLSARPGLDGLSLRDTLMGNGSSPSERELYWHFPHYHHLGIGPCGAVRVGRWKLIEWFERSIGENGRALSPHELFDLERDPGEENDLAALQPRVAGELAEKLAAWRRTVGAQTMVPNPSFVPDEGNQSAPPPPGDLPNPYRQ